MTAPLAFIAANIAFTAGVWLAEISGLPWLLLSIAAVGFGSTYRAPLLSVVGKDAAR